MRTHTARFLAFISVNMPFQLGVGRCSYRIQYGNPVPVLIPNPLFIYLFIYLLMYLFIHLFIFVILLIFDKLTTKDVLKHRGFVYHLKRDL